MQKETVVEVPPDTFLPITTKRLTARLAGLLQSSSEVDQWEDFVDNLRVVVALHYEFVMNEVREVLDEFESESPEVLEGVDARKYFCSINENLSTLFDASQYTTLTEATFTTAQEVEYEFDFPTNIDWHKFDPAFLQADDTHPNPDWDALKRHMTVFTRGVRQTSKTGFFFPQKMELLLTFVHEWFRRWYYGKKGVTSSETTPTGKQAKGSKKVVRRSLRDVCEAKGFFAMLPKKVEVKEPMFDRVCVVYKNKGKTRVVAKAQNAAKKIISTLRLRKSSTGQEPVTPMVATESRGLRGAASVEIALFREVPFGDLEAVFPHKVISLKRVDTVAFVVKIVSAVVILLLTMKNLFTRPEEGEERVRGTLLLILLLTVAIVKQVVGLVMGWLNLRKGYERDVANWTQVRTEATGMPVVAQLVDDVKEQELKEMMLAYFFLWQSKKPCTAEEIDAHVESFLLTRFSHRIDFDEDDGMQKLLHLGLVTTSAPDTYTLHHTPASWIDAHPHEPLTSTSIRTMPQPLRRVSHAAPLHPLFCSDR